MVNYIAKRTVVLLTFFVLVAHSVVNFPYPQEKNYGNGTINVTSANASSDLKAKFQSFYNGFYESGTGANSNLGRIKSDDVSATVSEGIGYGMIMMVYFSEDDISYQGEFDKLWAYYNKFLDQKGLMHWRINGFSSVSGENAATDAEFDVALALTMAYYQFGDEKYRTDASALIAKIRLHEMDDDGLHKPGDAWNDRKNPSYVSPAAFEIFKSFDDSDFWGKAITRNYTFLKNNQNSTTGLPSDWSDNTNGTPGSYYYGYDAARAPWRWAWSNAWFGHEDAKTLLSKLAPWVNDLNPENVGGTIKPDGTEMWNDKNSTFVGPLMNTLSYKSDYQTKFNSFWTKLMSLNNEPYFSAALQILTGLLATGNMPDLKALSEGSITPSSSSEIPSSSSIAPSSSSVAGSSSSSNGATPVILSQIALNNALSPMQNAVNLQSVNDVSLSIFDLNGSQVRRFNFTRGNHFVSLSDLPRGLYILKAKNVSWSKTVKIIVK